MEDIAENYGALHHDLNILYNFACAVVHSDIGDSVMLDMIKEELADALDKAQKYDELRFKHSQGGKKSSSNMTKEQRIARARKAGSSK